MNPRQDTEVKLVVAGRELSRWQSYEVESDMLTPADAFHFVASNAAAQMVGVVEPEQEARVVVDGTTALIGRIDEVTYEGDGDGAKVTITGRDRGRYLTDCSAAVISRKGQTLKSLAELLTREWIPVWQVSGNRPLPQVKKFKVDPGDTVLDVLNRYAEAAGMIVWIDEQGRGIIGRPDYTQKPLFSIYRYRSGSELRTRNNTLSGRVASSTRERFSQVVVLSAISNGGGRGLFASGSSSLFGTRGRGASKLKGRALDAALVAANVHKPKCIPGQSANTAQARAKAEETVARAQFEGWSAVYTVKGHAQGGEVWRTNTLCTLVDELAGVDGKTCLVRRRRLIGGEHGRTTEVTLHEAGVWLP